MTNRAPQVPGETTSRTPKRDRVLEWLRRYAPAEAAAVLGAVLAAGVVDRCGVAIATAFAGAVGETVAFYTVIILRDKPNGLATMRRLLLEFGPAELLDTVAVRPLTMYLTVALVGNAVLGIVLGKLAADIVFYTLAIIGYELGKSIKR